MKDVCLKEKIVAENVERIFCDFCGKEVVHNGYFDDSEAKIYAKIGEVYPEGKIHEN